MRIAVAANFMTDLPGVPVAGWVKVPRVEISDWSFFYSISVACVLDPPTRRQWCMNMIDGFGIPGKQLLVC